MVFNDSFLYFTSLQLTSKKYHRDRKLKATTREQFFFFEKYHPLNGPLIAKDYSAYMKKVEEGYVGVRKDDKMHGKGKYTYADGSVYEGEWRNNMKNGKGKYISVSGSVYEGEWKDDKMHGKGKYTYACTKVNGGII
jgi:hypothetical protein